MLTVLWASGRAVARRGLGAKLVVSSKFSSAVVSCGRPGQKWCVLSWRTCLCLASKTCNATGNEYLSVKVSH